MSEMIERGGVTIAADVAPLFESVGLRSFDDFMGFAEGTRICHKRGRSVVRFEIAGRAFYLKRNRLHGVEFWKALTRLRWPSLGAMVEWQNILNVQQAGIPTVPPVAVGERRSCGLEVASFTITEEIYGAEPLDAVARREFTGSLTTEKQGEKRRLIREMAAVSRQFHGSGMNHQDFYLNHFFRGRDGTIFLLDLQRVECRPNVPQRRLVKDLAQLNYSAYNYGVGTGTDRMRFLHAYLGVTTLGGREKKLARLVAAKTARIARHDVKLLARRRRRGELPSG